MEELFEKYHFDVVIKLVAQVGVRYFIDYHDVYIESYMFVAKYKCRKLQSKNVGCCNPKM